MDDDGSGISPKQKFRKLYKETYQKTYSNWYYVTKNDYIKDTRIRRTYSGRKLRETGYVYLKCSPYPDAEGSSHLRSCIHDAIINAAQRIGEISTNWDCIDSVHQE